MGLGESLEVFVGFGYSYLDVPVFDDDDDENSPRSANQHGQTSFVVVVVLYCSRHNAFSVCFGLLCSVFLYSTPSSSVYQRFALISVSLFKTSCSHYVVGSLLTGGPIIRDL